MTGMQSQAEFEQAYADRSNITVDQLHEFGRSAFPCDCEEEGCEGWQMVNAADHIDDLRLRNQAIPAGVYHLNRDVSTRPGMS